MTHLSRINQLPPFVCWLLARRNRRPITQAEIAKATGWSLKKVRRFCGLQSWDNVPLKDIDPFRMACGITIANERRHREYLKRTLDLERVTDGFTHFRKRPKVAQRRVARLMRNRS